MSPIDCLISAFLYHFLGQVTTSRLVHFLLFSGSERGKMLIWRGVHGRSKDWDISGRQDVSPFTKDKDRCFVFLAGLNCISGSCCFPFSSRLVVMRFVQAITYYQSSLMHESFDSISQLGRTAQKGSLLFLVCSSEEWFELTISFTEAHPKPLIWG